MELWRTVRVRPVNPNKRTKTLRVWFNQDCKAAQRRLQAARRRHGRTSPEVRQRRKEYTAALRAARRDYTRGLEGLRLSSPADFWRLLKPPKQQSAAPLAALHTHYTHLLPPPRIYPRGLAFCSPSGPGAGDSS